MLQVIKRAGIGYILIKLLLQPYLKSIGILRCGKHLAPRAGLVSIAYNNVGLFFSHQCIYRTDGSVRANSSPIIALDTSTGSKPRVENVWMATPFFISSAGGEKSADYLLEIDPSVC